MPRQKPLTSHQRAELTTIPDDPELLSDTYTFTAEELGWIRDQNGPVNQLGFGVQLALMKYPGVTLSNDWTPSGGLIRFVAEQIDANPDCWQQYSRKEHTVLDHRTRIRRLLRVEPYQPSRDRAAALKCIEDLAIRTEHGPTVVRALIENFRKWRILLPAVSQLELLAAEAITHGERAVHATLNGPLKPEQRTGLQALLKEKRYGKYELTWLTETVEAPTAGNFAGLIERLVFVRRFRIPESLREKVNPERLARIAEITSDTHLPSLRDLKPEAQCAKLVAIVLEFEARITDELLAMFGKLVAGMYVDAKRRHLEKQKSDQESLLDAALLVQQLHPILKRGRAEKKLPYDDIERVISWEDFERLVADLKARTKNHGLGPLPFVLHSYGKIRRCSRLLLENMEFQAAPAVRDVLNAVNALRAFYGGKLNASELPDAFVPNRWKPLVGSDSRDRLKYYELCAMTRLNECLRSGDISVKTSHRFRDFEDYLVTVPKYNSMKAAGGLPLAIDGDCDKYLEQRLAALESEVQRVEDLIKQGVLEDVSFDRSGRPRIDRLEGDRSLEAVALSNTLYSRVPIVQITDVMQEMEARSPYLHCFQDIRSRHGAHDKKILFAALLAKGLNISCEKMANATPDKEITKARLENCSHFCLRPEAYTAAMGVLTNGQKASEISKYWGDATTSSSDGQWLRTTRTAYDTGAFRGNYESGPGLSVITNVCDLWSPLFAYAIAGAEQEAPYTLDTVLYVDPTIAIKEHYTDTAGFVDYLFAFTHIFGIVYASRVRRFHTFKLHLPRGIKGVERLASIVSPEAVDLDAIRENWDHFLRAGTSIKIGTVRASALMRKLASYPRQNQLHHAITQFGRIEKSLFMLRWMSDPAFRRQVNRGLNKGEAVHAITKEVASVGRAGEIRDKTLEQQIRRANGFNFLVALISAWNTFYLDQAWGQLRRQGVMVEANLLRNIGPLGHEHINLTGDYVWSPPENAFVNGVRPLRGAI